MTEEQKIEYPKLEPEFKTKWLEDLRSGKYKQTKGTLCEKGDPNLEEVDTFCCLGVAGITAGVSPERMYNVGDFKDYLPFKEVPEILQIKGETMNHAVNLLIKMNDEEGKSFLEIADWIEENL